MTTSVWSRLAPLAGFVAAVVYCAWPYLFPSPRPVPKASLLPRMESASLKPAIDPASDRDPFARVRPDAATKPPAAPAPAPARHVALASNLGPNPKATASAPAARGPDERKAVQPASIADGLKLGATMVGGARRAAIINGKVYSQGETIVVSEGFPSSWTLSRVERDGVALVPRSGGRTVNLAFARRDGSPNARDSASGPSRDATRPTIEVAGKGTAPRFPLQFMKLFEAGVPNAYWNLFKSALDIARRPGIPAPADGAGRPVGR